MSTKLLSGYGLKYNPFLPDVPPEALIATPKVQHFLWRIENAHVPQGGFALVSGEPGSGKSSAMRLLFERLAQLPEMGVAVIEHPQSGVADFYRELGEHFGVALRPHNRWVSFKMLRERFAAHIDSTLVRPVLLVDEAQEMHPKVMSELRILSSTRFDSRSLLSVVLAGDGRLLDKLRCEELLPLGSRVRTRLVMEAASREELVSCLNHLMRSAGNPKLMTKPLVDALADHAMGNYRAMTTMAADLFAVAMHREVPQLDEKLFLEVFDPSAKKDTPARGSRKRRR
jgi:type II secretory pathway predicted ATPase ExeA